MILRRVFALSLAYPSPLLWIASNGLPADRTAGYPIRMFSTKSRRDNVLKVLSSQEGARLSRLVTSHQGLEDGEADFGGHIPFASSSMPSCRNLSPTLDKFIRTVKIDRQNCSKQCTAISHPETLLQGRLMQLQNFFKLIYCNESFRSST